jgi:hypothetical protein
MTIHELLEKIKTVSTIGTATSGDSHTHCSPPYVLEAKEVSHITSYPEPGKACNTCQHYHLHTPLDPDTQVPPKPQHDYDEEELINMVKLPVYYGCCSRFLAKTCTIIYGVRSDEGCPLWEEKPIRLQFDDNVILEDDGRTPIAPTRVAEF